MMYIKDFQTLKIILIKENIMPNKDTNIKIQPTVVIGLGGTGMNTIIRLKRRAAEEFGLPLDKTCPQLRFLLVDTDDPEETLRSEQNIDISDFNIKPEEIFKATAEDISEDKIRQESSIQQWFPDEQALYSAVNDFQKGARAIKALGRLAFFWNYNQIKEKLRPLFSIPFELMVDSEGNIERAFSVYVVGSLAGGTGAGMFLDMGYLVKSLKEDGDISYNIDVRGLFVLGEIHSAKAGDRTIANTYASLKELNYYMRPDTTFKPHYKDGSSSPIKKKPYDLIYLFGASNRQVNFESAAQLTEMLSQFIFIDSSTSVAEHIWRYRVNKSHYTAVVDDRGTPFCYSSMGLCIIRFPWQQILELCAVKFAQKIIKEHFLRPEETKNVDIDEAVRTFLKDKCLICNEESKNDSFDLSKKLISMGDEDEQSYLESAISMAFNEYSDTIKNINPVKQTRNTLNSRVKQLKNSIDDYISQLLTHTKNAIKEEIRSIIKRKDSGGIQFAVEFCNKLHQACKETNAFAHKELKAAQDRTEKLGNKLTSDGRQLQSILGGIILLFKNKAKREQLEITLRSMKNVFLNELYAIRYSAVTRFMEVLLDSRGHLRNEGFMPFLTREIERLEGIKNLMDRIFREMEETFEQQSQISSSTFDQVVFDSKTLAEFHDVFDPIDKNESQVPQVAKRIVKESSKMFDNIDGNSVQADLGLSINPFQEKEYQAYRSLFLEACRAPFYEPINRYNVEERIYRSIERGGPDYLVKMKAYYKVSQHYAVFDQGIVNLARFREDLQTFFMIGIEDSDKSQLPKHFQQKVSLRPGEETGNFITTRDKHQIIIFREVHGFPAYMLKSCKSYLNKYTMITKDAKENPLQMVQENLENYEPPDEKVVFKYEKRSVEGIVLGTIIPEEDEDKKLIYMMLDLDERQRRKKAQELKNQNKKFNPNDITCGHKLDSSFERSVSDKIHLQSDSVTGEKYLDILVRNTNKVKEHIEKHDQHLDENNIVNLFLAFYHEFPLLKDDPTLQKKEIQGIIKSILWSEYRIDDLERKTSKSYQELLDELGL